MARDGVIEGWGPQLSPAAMGYTVTAFATLEIRQAPATGPGARRRGRAPGVDPGVYRGAHDHRRGGRGAPRIVARSNADLQRVIDRLVDFEGIVRTSTVIALATQIPPEGAPPAAGLGPPEMVGIR